MPYISIRIFNAFGPRFQTKGAYGSVIGVFLKQKLSKKPITLVGDGNQSRDYVHVKDVAKAFYLAAISKNKNQIFNLGSNKPIKINNIIKLVKPTKVEKIPNRPGEPRKTHANISKIQKMLGWQPEISFEDGFKNLLKNIDEWKNAPLWDKKKIESYIKLV